MEARKLKIQFVKAGSGSISTKISVPKSWIDLLHINPENREVIAIYDEKEGSIKIRKMKECESELSNEEIKATIDNVNASMEMEGFETIQEEDEDGIKILKGEVTATELIAQKLEKYKR